MIQDLQLLTMGWKFLVAILGWALGLSNLFFDLLEDESSLFGDMGWGASDGIFQSSHLARFSIRRLRLYQHMQSQLYWEATLCYIYSPTTLIWHSIIRQPRYNIWHKFYKLNFLVIFYLYKMTVALLIWHSSISKCHIVEVKKFI